MDIRAAEISDIIRKQIENYDKKVSVTETGTVLTAGDGIARVYGLSGALAGELLEFEGAGGVTVQGGGALMVDHGPVPESPACDPLHAVAATSSTAIATHLTAAL